MKSLTLDLWDKIIDTIYAESLNNLRMLGHVTKSECERYLAFYGVHGGLFWCEQDGCLAGVATAHPGKSLFNWQWPKESGTWTTHLVWAKNKDAIAEVVAQLLISTCLPVTELWAQRGERLTLISETKLERLLSYGRK